MFSIFRRGIFLLLCLLFLLPIVPTAAAASETQEISSASLVTGMVKLESCGGLFEGCTDAPVQIPDRTRLTLEYAEGIGSLYIKFYMEYGPFPGSIG